MAQKIIPKSFRLSYFKNWESSSIILRENYSNLFFFEYNVYIYLKKLCISQQITLNKIKIKKKRNSFRVYVSLFYKPSSYKIDNQKNYKSINADLVSLSKKKEVIIQNLQNYCQSFLLGFDIDLYFFVPGLGKTKKKIYNRLRYKLNVQGGLPMYWKTLYSLMFKIIWSKSVYLLNNFLIKNLKTNKKHLYYLRNFEKIFNKIFKQFPNFIGYKIQWKGRLNGKQRAKKIVLKAGKVPLNTLQCHIKYDFQEVITPSGVCSLKTWLLFSKRKNVITKKN
jgi:ribosomal protein S3